MPPTLLTLPLVLKELYIASIACLLHYYYHSGYFLDVNHGELSNMQCFEDHYVQSAATKT